MTRTEAVGEILSCVAAGERLALTAARVGEIIRVRATTRVPQMPPCLLGVLGLRGTVLPVLSLAILLGFAQAPPGPAARIVVLDGAAPIGLLVDSVAALTTLSDERWLDLDVLLAKAFVARPAQPSQRAAQSMAETMPAAAVETRAFFGFRQAGLEYALPLDRVIEVLGMPPTIAELPGGDSAMLGLIPSRIGLLPLVSLSALLGCPAASPITQARIVVTRLGTAPFGLVVDRLTEILRVPESRLDPVPVVLSRGRGEARFDAICRLDAGRRLVCILAPERLFDAATSARISASAEPAASEPASVADASMVARFVLFRLGDEQYGMPIEAVQEVVRRPANLARVPLAAGCVLGVVNRRGRALAVIDQRARFGATAGTGGQVMIVATGEIEAGLVVDAVSDVLAVPAADLRPAPDLTADNSVFDRVATTGTQPRMILLVDPFALLAGLARDMRDAVARVAA